MALARVQGDTSSWATAVEAWLALLQTFPAKFKDEKAKVVERSLHCMRDPLFLATFLLDHRHSGLGLSAEQLVSARTYLEDLSEDPASVALFFGQGRRFRCAAIRASRRSSDLVASWSPLRFPPFAYKHGCAPAVLHHVERGTRTTVLPAQAYLWTSEGTTAPRKSWKVGVPSWNLELKVIVK